MKGCITKRWMDERMNNERMKGWKDERMTGLKDEGMKGRKDERMNVLPVTVKLWVDPDELSLCIEGLWDSLSRTVIPRRS